MERELFSIEQSARGWVVYTANGGNEPPDPTPLVALEHAEQLASARHRSTGRPTGVKVKLRCGDTVLVACHGRSEEHTSELQSLMRISYAVFCLKKKTNYITQN